MFYLFNNKAFSVNMLYHGKTVHIKRWKILFFKYNLITFILEINTNYITHTNTYIYKEVYV